MNHVNERSSIIDHSRPDTARAELKLVATPHRLPNPFARATAGRWEPPKSRACADGAIHGRRVVLDPRRAAHPLPPFRVIRGSAPCYERKEAVVLRP